ncbi:hypothetical protein CBA19CS91_24495 [Paraburkholderia hospita]|nr:hypothetical protein CBA19CS91_24495 [Paraburkholderia hospita]
MLNRKTPNRPFGNSRPADSSGRTTHSSRWSAPKARPNGRVSIGLTDRRQLVLRPRARPLRGIEAPLQQARLVACITQLRLERGDGAMMVRLAPIRQLRGFVDFLLQLRDGASLAIGLE